ncbi:hypothetical protein V6251_13280 [Olleya sp. Ti.3.14]|uniref:hypothetical protein n=1 Tax=Olleya sp. Ti.3.14 TaxID=3121297 RepID=UPI00311F87B9
MEDKKYITLSEFHSDVKKSINLIGNSTKSLENNELLNLLTQNGIEENNAVEIIIFLPIAFVRKMLPNINWRKNYIEQYSDRKQITKNFSDNEQYGIIEKETESYYNRNPKSETILNIAGRSAEFRAINELLLKDDKANISDINLTENIILRTE